MRHIYYVPNIEMGGIIGSSNGAVRNKCGICWDVRIPFIYLFIYILIYLWRLDPTTRTTLLDYSPPPLGLAWETPHPTPPLSNIPLPCPQPNTYIVNILPSSFLKNIFFFCLGKIQIPNSKQNKPCPSILCSLVPTLL